MVICRKRSGATRTAGKLDRLEERSAGLQTIFQTSYTPSGEGDPAKLCAVMVRVFALHREARTGASEVRQK